MQDNFSFYLDKQTATHIFVQNGQNKQNLGYIFPDEKNSIFIIEIVYNNFCINNIKKSNHPITFCK